MCAACHAGYQEIRNLFNHANTRAEITNTISNFFYSVRMLCLDSPAHLPSDCTFSYAFREPPPPLGTYVLFELPRG